MADSDPKNPGSSNGPRPPHRGPGPRPGGQGRGRPQQGRRPPQGTPTPRPTAHAPQGARPPGTPKPAGALKTGLRLRQVSDFVFELDHPPCVDETEPDYEEGLEIWKAGEPEEARDALRFALSACRDNLWVHVALGQIALRESNDAQLAIGHFGYVLELANHVIPPRFSGTLPPTRRNNRPLFDALDGLIECFEKLKKPQEAARYRAQRKAWAGQG